MNFIGRRKRAWFLEGLCIVLVIIMQGIDDFNVHSRRVGYYACEY